MSPGSAGAGAPSGVLLGRGENFEKLKTFRTALSYSKKIYRKPNSMRIKKNTSKKHAFARMQRRRLGRRFLISCGFRPILGSAVGSIFGQPAAPFLGQQLPPILGTRLLHFWISSWLHFGSAGCSSFEPPGWFGFAHCLDPFSSQAGCPFLVLLLSFKRPATSGASNTQNVDRSRSVV